MVSGCIGCGAEVQVNHRVCKHCWRVVPQEIKEAVRLTYQRRLSGSATDRDAERHAAALDVMWAWLAARNPGRVS